MSESSSFTEQAPKGFWEDLIYYHKRLLKIAQKQGSWLLRGARREWEIPPAEISGLPELGVGSDKVAWRMASVLGGYFMTRGGLVIARSLNSPEAAAPTDNSSKVLEKHFEYRLPSKRLEPLLVTHLNYPDNPHPDAVPTIMYQSDADPSFQPTSIDYRQLLNEMQRGLAVKALPPERE
jgi:hypothetical protein